MHVRQSEHAISEVIDGEVLIVSLSTGAYYSLNESAGAVWTAVERPASRNDVAAALRGFYDADGDVVERAADDALGELSREGLVEPVAGADPAVAADAPSTSADSRGRKPLPWPSIEKHTDMAYLIGMDPLHETDTALGWPHPSG